MGKKSSAGSYSTSPAQFVILGILLLVLAVVAYALFLKKSTGG